MDFTDFILQLPASKAVKNEVCKKHTLMILEHLAYGTKWALSMLDSSSKIPSGLLDGNTVELGNYDECVNVNVNEEWGSFRGQHCLATAVVTLDGKTDELMTWSMCIPSTCKSVDLNDFLVAAFNYSVPLFVNATGCHTQDARPFELEDKLAVFIISLCCVLCIIATFHDLFISDPKKRNNYILAFSWYTNGLQLMKTRTSPRDDILCLHGLRFISASLIIAGHTYFLREVTPTVNMRAFRKMGADWPHIAISIAVTAVETFFLLSGLLLGYLFFKNMKKGAKFNLLQFYLVRYVRLTPVLAVAVLVHTGLLLHMGSGPLWDNGLIWYPNVCRKNWWATLLYILNYVHKEEMCMTITWFLAVDTQLYILSPLLLFPILRKPRFGIVFLQLLTLGSIASSFLFPYVNNTRTKFQSTSFITADYFYTHTRASSWLIGVTLSYIIFRTRSWREAVQAGTKSGMPKKYVAAGWVGAFLCAFLPAMWAHRFLQIDFEPSSLEYSAFVSLTRPLWCLGICWIIFACISGYGGPLNIFLSWGFFHPLSRLTYSIYIIHFPFLLMKTFSIKTASYFNDLVEIQTIFGSIVTVVLLSIPTYLTFESPAVNFMKLLCEGKKTKNNRQLIDKDHKIDMFNNNNNNCNSNVVAGSCFSRRQPFPSHFHITEQKII